MTDKFEHRLADWVEQNPEVVRKKVEPVAAQSQQFSATMEEVWMRVQDWLSDDGDLDEEDECFPRTPHLSLPHELEDK